MPSPFDSLDETFDIQPKEVEVKPVPMERESSAPIVVSDTEEDVDKDYQYARAQLYNIVDKMQETLNDAMEVAQQSEHPRAFEVVFQGAKHAADVVDKIGDLHKKVKDLKKEDKKTEQNNTNTQNNIFMAGSTEDLMKMLREKDK